MPTLTDLAWAAGFFDGEGSTMAVLSHNGRQSRYLAITVNQKDRRPLDRWAAIFGGAVSGPYAGMHRWTASGRRARDILESMWLYLSEPKREQVAAVETRIAEHNAMLRPRLQLTSEHRRKLSDAQRGVPKSDLHRRRIGDALRGRPLSPQHREALSEAAKRRRSA